MNAIEIVKKYLKESGFDGLYNDDECGCALKDLAPCNSDFSSCKPGYKVFSPEGYAYICENKDAQPWVGNGLLLLNGYIILKY